MTRTHAHAHTQWRKSVRLVLMRFQPLIIKSHTERERERERRAELQDYPLSFQPSIFVTRTLICLPSHFFFPVTLFFFFPQLPSHTHNQPSVSPPSSASFTVTNGAVSECTAASPRPNRVGCRAEGLTCPLLASITPPPTDWS